MADEGGFDPCECIWNHELAMRRLISLLRSTQTYCTDSECLTDVPGIPGQAQPNNEPNMLFFTLCWVALALALFFLRPPSLRRQGDTKPNENQGPGPQPPNPPAVN